MPEVDLVFPRAYVEFADPGDADQVFRCDLTWLTSRYHCIFGQGCKGIYADAPDTGLLHPGRALRRQGRRAAGRGLRRAARPDAVAVPAGAARSARTTGSTGTTRATARRGSSSTTASRRASSTTATDFATGAGCALHSLALRQGRNPLETKPDVCWQLPIRRTFRTVERQDDTSYTEVSIGEYDRRGWGPGGHDLDWYCSGNTEAHTAPDPLYVTNEAELVELMGRPAYDELVDALRAPSALARDRLAVHPADPRLTADRRPELSTSREPDPAVPDAHDGGAQCPHAPGPSHLRRRP